jgi:SAM-dependent methyltransferase
MLNDPGRSAESPDAVTDAKAQDHDRHAAILARLTRPHYASVIEVGCSIGGLSGWLRQRCDRFLGIDMSERSLRTARLRLAHCDNVALRQVEVPRRWPRRTADLIVLSDLLPCLNADALSKLARRVDRSLMPGAEVVILVSTTGPDRDLTGPAAARVFMRALSRLRPLRVSFYPEEGAYQHYTLICARGAKA